MMSSVCVGVCQFKCRCWGNKGSLFSCFTVGELGEEGWVKGRALSQISPMFNLIDI